MKYAYLFLLSGLTSKVIFILFWVWLSFILRSVFAYSAINDSNIVLYWRPFLYFNSTGFNRFIIRFFDIYENFNFGFVFQAYSSLFIYWTVRAILRSESFALCPIQLTNYFYWINGSQVWGLHWNSSHFSSPTHGTLHTNKTVSYPPSITLTNPSTKMLVLPHTIH